MKFNYQSFSAFIGAGYCVIGILVIFYNKFFIEMEPFWARLFGFLFIVYGLFRIYRALKHIKRHE